jgi:hypothetical protein
VQRSLPEMNEAKSEGKLPFQMFALHRGGDNPKARKIIDGKDANGKDWSLDFVWSSPDFEKKIGLKGLPSYYLVDKTGRVRALFKGHPAGSLETLKWLASEIEKHA